ncbi:MAG: CHASE2 domain-containing protein [Treponema sp.]|nr:CHASE2 domain-containing protein [Treponema sp.]
MAKFDYRVYDLLLGFRDSPQERNEILLVDIDDTALGKMGPWPWTRDVIADSLLRMKELGAETAVFDIEYLSESEKSIDEKLLQEIQKHPQENAAALSRIYKDNDGFFANSIQFFGNTWLTINAGNLGESYSEEDIDYAKKRFLWKVEDEENFFEKSASKKTYQDFSPARNKFISRAKGAGYTNVVIDSDGSRRRIKLFLEYDDGCLGQLVVAPLMGILKPERIERKARQIIFYGCKNPSTKENAPEKINIKIPLDKDGAMLIHWLKKPFLTTDAESGEIDSSKTSFNHNSIYYLWLLSHNEEIIADYLHRLKSLEKYDFKNGYGESPAAFTLIDELVSNYEYICEIREELLTQCKGYDAAGNAIDGGLSSEYLDAYFAMRQEFFEKVESFISTPELNDLVDVINHSENLSDEDYSYIAEIFQTFEVFNNAIIEYNGYFPELKEMYKGKFCIIGNTGSGTTDLGTTPFNTSYPNVGTHANVYNTILAQDFITPLDWQWGFIVLSILAFIFIGWIKTKAVIQNIIGIVLILISIFIPVLAMVVFACYIPAVASILVVVTSYLGVTIFNFATSEKDKKFLQTTFGAYVAPAVVDQIVKNPEIAKLGGKSDNLTALFSDVKSFSAFTEVINNEEGEDKGAERLVAVLNDYLGVLSDAIMDNNGTIDKYVGDEIVSFFGAPIHDENNAYDACIAGIRMLEAERRFNEENKGRLPINPATGEPFFLHSRVGLNTGNMVVGNMGTEKKLNYTIMGNNVNLASRLEGTNKAYGSWIMCSESTWKAANIGDNQGKILARKLDYVRVINVKRPVGIYSIIGLKSELSDKRIKATELFNEGMKWYLKGIDAPNKPKDPEDFKKAYAFYKQADELYPADESSKVFMARCVDFLKNGTPKVWDGVYTMQSK